VAKGKGKGKRDAAENFLAGFGISGAFDDLVKKMVIQGWSLDEFALRLARTRQFKNAFPGLVGRKGIIHPDFVSGAAAGASALVSAVTNYNKGLDDFRATAAAVGYTGNVGPRVFGMAIRNDISPDEWGRRITIATRLRSDPGLLDMYNEQRTFAGLKPLQPGEFLKGLAKNDPGVIDAYQAAYLRQAGLDLTAEQAGAVAQGIDSPLQPNMDLGRLVQEINRIKPDIGPELRGLGVGDDKLALLASGSDPDNLAPKLEQLIAQRRSSSQVARGSGMRQSSTGGLSLFEEDQAAAY
jgi:hypothetical protein